MSVLAETVKSQSFIEKVVLLALTALLTGMLVPFVMGKVQDSRNRKQKALDAETARQSQVIQAQSEFINKLGDLLLEYEMLADQVAYYKGNVVDEKRYAAAYDRYEEKSFDYLTKIRAEVRKSQRLISPALYSHLVETVDHFIDPIDVELVTLVKKQGSFQEWRQLFFRIQKIVREDMTSELNQLAEAMQLSVKEQGNLASAQ